MNLFLGIFLTLIFIIFAIFAFIPRQIYVETDSRPIGLLIKKPDDNLKKKIIDIKNVTIAKEYDNFVLIYLPHYLEFTNCVKSLALIGIDFVEIAGNNKVQLKLTGKNISKISNNEQIELYRYYIVDNSDYEIILNVTVKSLGSFIRSCNKNKIIIDQIFDF